MIITGGGCVGVVPAAGGCVGVVFVVGGRVGVVPVLGVVGAAFVVSVNTGLANDASVSPVSATLWKKVYDLLAVKPLNTLLDCQLAPFIENSNNGLAVSVMLLCVLLINAGAAGAGGPAIFRTAVVAALGTVPVSTLDVISRVISLPRLASVIVYVVPVPTCTPSAFHTNVNDPELLPPTSEPISSSPILGFMLLIIASPIDCTSTLTR